MSFRVFCTALLLLAAACTRQRAASAGTPIRPVIHQLDVGRGTNAYLVVGRRPILVDTGWGMSTAKLEQAMAEVGVEPRDLALIVLTHGHGDHAGGAERMRALSGAKVLAQRGDLGMMRAGKNTPLKPMGLLGKVLRSYSDKPFPSVVPDIAIDDSYSLAPYGVQGMAIALPGHTPGSLAVILPSGDAIVGDLVRGGAVRSSAPKRHLFHDDCKAAESHLEELLRYGVRTLYLGHGGPVDAHATLQALQGVECPEP